MKKSTMSLRPVAMAALACLSALSAGMAHAGEDETPLWLSLAHSITRDNNFSRNEEKQAETVNTTSLRAGLDKSYGRQTYRAAAKLAASRYANFGDRLNNESKDLDASFTTGIASNWVVSTGGSFSENLVPIQDNRVDNRVVRNIKTYRDGNVAVQYGNGGLWAVVGTFDTNKQTYSEDVYKLQNANQTSTGLKAVYYSTDLLNFSLGGRVVKTNYPNNRSDLTTTDRNVDLSTDWQVSGLSSLEAVLTRRNTTYSNGAVAVSGWTGSLNWTYTPRGLISYGLGLSRTTGADRQKSTLVDTRQNVVGSSEYASDTVTTALRLSANLRATAKLSFGVNHNISRYEQDVNSTTTVGSNSALSGGKYNSIRHTTSLNSNYAVTRAFNLGCGVQRYSQTKDLNRPNYDGRSVDCNASFTLD